MSDLRDVDPENEETGQPEIESPVDGPPPDWMKTATSAEGSSFKADQAPEWLKNIRAGKSQQAEPEAADVDSSAKEEAGDNMSDLERLLAEEGIEPSGVADERPEGAEGMTVKDWMIATSDDEIIRKRVGAEPFEESVPMPASEPEPIEPEPASEPGDILEEELPDWLREISDDVETAPPVATTPEPVAAVVEAEDDDKMVVDEDLPDWLREVSAEVQSTDEAAMTEAIPVEAQEDMMLPEEELPDWLQGISDEPALFGEPAVDTSVSAGEEAADEGMPDWLQEVADEPPELTVSATTDDKLVVTDELPSWLREVEEDQEELPAAFEAPEQPEPILAEADEDISDEDLPDWLREAEGSSLDEQSFEPEFETAPPSYSLTDSSDTAIDEENLPDWLRDVQEDEVEPVPEPVVDLAESGGEEDVELEEQELPDWLKEVQTEEEIGTPVVETPSLAVEPEPTLAGPQGAAAGDELPDWLQEVEDESVEAAFEVEAVEGAVPEKVAEELPDWLQEVQVTDEESFEPFEPSEPSPDEFLAGEVEEEEAILEEELPDWLQEVEEEPEEVVALDQAAAAPPQPELEESLVVEEELPDWLRIEEETGVDVEEAPALVQPEPEPMVSEVLEPRAEMLAEPEVEAVEPVSAPPVIEEVAPYAEKASAATTGLTDMPDWLRKLREGDVAEEEVSFVPAKPLPKPAVVPVIAATEPEPAVEAHEAVEVAVPEEASERLELARSARDAGNIAEALQYYESLVSSGTYLDRVIEDIQQTVKSYPANVMLYQIMGDAMMKDGRLQSALDAYRTALTKL